VSRMRNQYSGQECICLLDTVLDGAPPSWQTVVPVPVESAHGAPGGSLSLLTICRIIQLCIRAHHASEIEIMICMVVAEAV
jgi:hypothetical protein